MLQSTTPKITKNWASNIPSYKALRQYYNVLLLYSSSIILYNKVRSHYQVLLCTTPAPPCTTNNYSSTTPYYSNITLRLYYKMPHQTTKYYASTTLHRKVWGHYYKGLRHYYSALQCTTPVRQCYTVLRHHSVLNIPTPVPVLKVSGGLPLSHSAVFTNGWVAE